MIGAWQHPRLQRAATVDLRPGTDPSIMDAAQGKRAAFCREQQGPSAQTSFHFITASRRHTSSVPSSPLGRETAEELQQGGVDFSCALLLRPVPASREHLNPPQCRHEMLQVRDQLVHAWG